MISSQKVVTLAYKLTDDTGTVLDQAPKADPFLYLHGANNIIPGLENSLEGMNIGDKKTIKVDAANAYGELNPSLKLQVNKSMFPAGEPIQAGDEFSGSLDGQNNVIFRIEAIEGENVYIDGNHPLAGKDLTFDVEVISVRDATKEELSHGHVHGPGGHHHH